MELENKFFIFEIIFCIIDNLIKYLKNINQKLSKTIAKIVLEIKIEIMRCGNNIDVTVKIIELATSADNII